MTLPIIALKPTEGGFVAAPVPQRQSNHFRTIEPPDEYRAAAYAALHGYMAALRERGVMLPDAWSRLAFVEPIDDVPADAYRLGYQGFYSADTPDVLYIVVPWTPPDELAWVVRHEFGHRLYYAAYGPDGSEGPWVNGPSERFADEVAGPHPHPERHMLEASGPLRELMESVFTRADIEPLPALPEASERTLRRVRALVAKAESTDSRPEAEALATKALDLIGHGAISVENSGGTVIIDGTSNMFLICAEPTVSIVGPNAGATKTASVNTTTYLGAQPFLAFLQTPDSYTQALPWVTTWDGTFRLSTSLKAYTSNPSADVTKSWVQWDSLTDQRTVTLYIHFFLLKEAAF